MQIVKPGTPVITTIGEIKALLTGVCMRNESVTYEISYFADGCHKTCWVNRFEFRIDDTKKGSVGLKDYNTPESNDQYLIEIK